MRVALLVLIVALAWPSVACANVVIQGPSWAQQAVSRMRVPVAPNQTVILAPCPGYAEFSAACNFPTPDSPIYMAPPFGPAEEQREILYRELGGRFETLAMYPWAVDHFERLVQRPSLMVNEDEMFEDAYADCAIGVQPWPKPEQFSDDHWINTFGYRPSRQRHARVCALIARVGAHARYETPRGG